MPTNLVRIHLRSCFLLQMHLRLCFPEHRRPYLLPPASNSMVNIHFLACRVTCALVCKLWRDIEKAYPVQPTSLQVTHPNLNSSYLGWHLRDTRQLVTIEVVEVRNRSKARSQAAMQKCLDQLLEHLELKAPLLTSFAMDVRGQVVQVQANSKRHWPLQPGLITQDVSLNIASLGGLTRLRELHLRNWMLTDAQSNALRACCNCKTSRSDFWLSNCPLQILLHCMVPLLCDVGRASVLSSPCQDLNSSRCTP